MMLNSRVTAVMAGAVLPALLVLLSGCATAKKAPRSYTFFPPAPDEPRLQFLTSFSKDADLGRTGSFADYVMGRRTGPTPLIKPYGLAIRNGQVFVCDTMASAIQVFDLSKRRARYFAPRGEGRLQTPINISIDLDGTIYVADSGRNQVLMYGKEDRYLGAIGTKNELKPTDVAISPDRLYVTDLQGHCVRVYNKGDKKQLFSIPKDPNDPKAKLFSPTNLALDQEGHLIVSDLGAFAVNVYDLEGNYIRTIGQQGVAPGLFARPKGVATDREGNVYVVDASTQVAQIFSPEGKLLLFFGQPGASMQGELYLPAAVKIDYDNLKYFQGFVAPGKQLEYLVFVTSQFGDNKVNVYGFLKK